MLHAPYALPLSSLHRTSGWGTIGDDAFLSQPPLGKLFFFYFFFGSHGRQNLLGGGVALNEPRYSNKHRKSKSKSKAKLGDCPSIEKSCIRAIEVPG